MADRGPYIIRRGPLTQDELNESKRRFQSFMSDFKDDYDATIDKRENDPQ